MSKHDHFDEDIYKSGQIDEFEHNGLTLDVKWWAWLDEDTGEWDFETEIVEAYDDDGNSVKATIENLDDLVQQHIGDRIYDY